MKRIQVAAAIIIHKDRILCVQRGENQLAYISKKFEFPGGKIEEGELPEETVLREIQEELNMEIEVRNQFVTVEHAYPDFHLTMQSFICSTKSKDLRLAEHISFKWLTRDKLDDLDWAAADLPIVEALKNKS